MSRSSAPLHLVSTADARFFPGLLTALASALAAASGEFAYRVTVLDGGLLDEQYARLEKTLAGIAQRSSIALEVDRLIPRKETIDALPSRRGSTLTYARLAIPHLLPADRIVYLDSDVLCLRGVEAFWKALTPDTALSAARDPLDEIGRDRTARQELPASLHAAPYFNAGVIGINLAFWRRPEVAAKIEALLGRAQGFRYVDQSLLNILFLGQWAEVDRLDNHVLTLRHCGEFPQLGERANFHYVGPHKPWLSRESLFYRHPLNHLFDLAWASLEGESSPRPPRQIAAASLARARRKARLYRLFQPRRAAEYRRGIEAAQAAEPSARAYWDRFGWE